MPVLSAPSITPQQCRDSFNLFDSAKNGELNVEEFKYAILALGFGDKTDDECREMMKLANASFAGGSDGKTYHKGKNKQHKKDDGDVDPNTNSIHYDAFEKMCLEKAPTWEEDLKNVFKLINVSGSGKISQADLQHMTRLIGENDADPVINQMIVEADVNDKDGEVNFDEFKKIMLLSAEMPKRHAFSNQNKSRSMGGDDDEY